MADDFVELDLITLAQAYRGDVVRQINRRVGLLKLLPIVAGEGKNVAWVPEADGQLTEQYSEGDDAANFAGDAQESAVLGWGLYRANLHVTKLAMDAARTSDSPLGNRLLWARQVVNGAAALASLLNSECYSGSGPGSIIGLDEAIGDDANTYATIVRGTSTYFQPTVVDPGSPTAPTFSQIRSDLAAIYVKCGENPDVAMCSPAIFNKVGGLFDATRRQVDNVMTARGPVRLEFGFQALEVDGVMFMKDKDATAETIYYINTNHVSLQYLPDSNMSALPQLGVQADDGFGEVPLGFVYEMLAKNGPSERAEILATCQLVVDRPNTCGVRLNVSST